MKVGAFDEKTNYFIIPNPSKSTRKITKVGREFDGSARSTPQIPDMGSDATYRFQLLFLLSHGCRSTYTSTTAVGSTLTSSLRAAS